MRLLLTTLYANNSQPSSPCYVFFADSQFTTDFYDQTPHSINYYTTIYECKMP